MSQYSVRLLSAMVRILGVATFAIGLAVVLGHATGWRWLTTWGGEQSMAFPTAAACLLLGTADALLAVALERRQ